MDNGQRTGCRRPSPSKPRAIVILSSLHYPDAIRHFRSKRKQYHPFRRLPHLPSLPLSFNIELYSSTLRTPHRPRNHGTLPFGFELARLYSKESFGGLGIPLIRFIIDLVTASRIVYPLLHSIHLIVILTICHTLKITLLF